MEHIDVMGKETIHLEYLPDIILMPNVGIRGVMWQEIEGKRRNSPGRMVFSIFHLEDLKTTFTHLTGEFRWELCKRVQGNRWNDVSISSLTSEYFDYIQFYRKNHDLSTEAKEKVKSSLQRAKNSFKEMFVRDYMIWVLFEGAGSPRLNKVARQIMFTYCPFPEDICNTLAQNPLYADLLDRRKIKVAQGLHHLDVLTRKLQNGNIPVPETVAQERYYLSGSKKASHIHIAKRFTLHPGNESFCYVVLFAFRYLMRLPAVCQVLYTLTGHPRPVSHGRSGPHRSTQ